MISSRFRVRDFVAPRNDVFGEAHMHLPSITGFYLAILALLYVVLGPGAMIGPAKNAVFGGKGPEQGYASEFESESVERRGHAGGTAAKRTVDLRERHMLYDTGNEPGPSRVPPLGEISPGQRARHEEQQPWHQEDLRGSA